MSRRSIYEVCQDGNVAELKELLDLSDDLDIDGIDASGMSALAYAARNGHLDVVCELISRGASTANAAKLAPFQDQRIESILRDENGSRQSDAQPQVTHHDQDHSSKYSTDEQFYHGPSSLQQNNDQQNHDPSTLSHGLPARDFYDDGTQIDQSTFIVPGMSPTHPSFGHQRTESGANLPPPEVARMIPCRFFPNCRYGDQCIFAHPIMAIPAAPLPDGASLSPSLPSPPPSHMQPIFYPSMPQGYQFPVPYPPFYPSQMAPSSLMHQSHFLPSNGQYMSPASQPTTQHTFQQSHDSQLQHTSDHTNAILQSRVDDQKEANPARQGSSSQLPQSNVLSSNETDPQEGVAEQQRFENYTDTHPQEDVLPDQRTEEGNLKAAHRRQSFNSFLQYHAIPFEPNGPAQAAMNGSFINGFGAMQVFHPTRYGPKAKRMPNSINGFGKRIHGDRPACTFFANSRCKYGDDCRFPHILPDGSDARSLQAQQRTLAELHQASSTKYKEVGGVPATAPTGPAASRIEEGHTNTRSEKENQQGLLAGQYKKTSTPLQSGQMNGHANGIVRSNPSKTSKQEANSPRGQINGTSTSALTKKTHVAQQPMQRVPTVNDFPALAAAAASPHLGSKDTGEFQSADRNGPVTKIYLAESEANGGERSMKLNGGENGAVNGQSATAKANFSAILSAPAPTRTKVTSTDYLKETNGTEAANALTAEPSNKDEAQNDSTLLLPSKIPNNGQINGQSNGGGSMSGRDGNRDVGGVRVGGPQNGSYRAPTASIPATKAQNDEEGENNDFQLVNRSRNSNKRSPNAQHHRPANVSQGYAAHAKAVAA